MDVAETELRKSQAAASVGRVYDPVPNATDQALGALESVFQTVETVRANYSQVPVSQRIARVRARFGSLLGAHISNDALSVLLTVDSGKLRQAEDDTKRIVKVAMGREIREDPARCERQRPLSRPRQDHLPASPSLAAALGEVAKDSIRPN